MATVRSYQVLDTPPEAEFDALTAIAAHIADVPIALVSIVDSDRQWFKSRYGLDAPETPRDVSFCGHVVAAEAPLIVRDAFEDPRFHDNPLVTGGPRVRFYAGVPLRAPDGHVVGTLCTIDHATRDLSVHQVKMLEMLAKQVVAQLELRRQNRLLAESRTEVEVTMRAVEETSSRLQSILDSANYAVIETAPDGVIRVFNAAAERMLGYRSEEVVGKVTPAILHDPGEVYARAKALSAELGVTVEPGFETFTAHARRGVVDELEWTYLRKDGTRFPVQLSITARWGGAGEVVGYMGIASDISERKRVDRLQSEFISTVSHELRTPLTSIRGALGLVSAGVLGELPPDAKEYVAIALSNSDRLVRLINDILDIEKMQSGTMEFRLRTLDLRGAVRRAIAANEGFASQHKVEIRESGDFAPGDVVADEDRLAQVIANLLSNAAKFSPVGASVEVSVHRVLDRMRVTVRDYGSGIPEEFRPRVFGRFAQADASSTRQKGGTGLGLNISKGIVERMRGTIGFEAAPGGGTAFFFDLPFVPTVEQYEDASADQLVLVCEDDPDVARVICRVLGTADLVSHVAPTLERARALLAKHRYLLMTLDLGLPDGDGAALISEVRAGAASKDLPIVVISGRGGHLESAVFEVADIIVKPFDPTRLRDALSAALGRRASHPAVALHVEDDPDVRNVIRRLLPASWDVCVADTLASARSQLRARPFDVVLLDLSLPDGTGTELLAEVGDASVVIFSAHEVPADISSRVAMALTKTRASEEEVCNRLVGLVMKLGARRP